MVKDPHSIGSGGDMALRSAAGELTAKLIEIEEHLIKLKATGRGTTQHVARLPAISVGDQQPYATRGCSPSELSAGPITPVVIYRFDMGVGRIDTDKQAMCLRCPSR